MGYKITRTTVALAAASSTFMHTQDAELRAAIDAVVKVNFDLDRVPNETLEVIYATFDDVTMKTVQDEFEFRMDYGAIVDYGACIGTCALCGKGDSRDDGLNEDKLRYGWRLLNVAGGKDLWVGHTCIMRYGLRVQGAATGEEARKALERALREHIAQWKIEAWRAANPTHATIPDEYEKLRRFATYGCTAVMWDWRALKILGIESYLWRKELSKKVKRAKAITNFYTKRQHLTDAKMPEWAELRELNKYIEWVVSCFTATRDLRGDDRERMLGRLYTERQQALEEARAAIAARRVRRARECA